MSRTHERNGPEHTATDDLKAKAVELSEDLRAMGSQVGEVAREQYEHVRGRALDFVKQGQKKARDWEAGMEEYIQERPVKSLLIAAGVGMLIGMFWRRR